MGHHGYIGLGQSLHYDVALSQNLHSSRLCDSHSPSHHLSTHLSSQPRPDVGYDVLLCKIYSFFLETRYSRRPAADSRIRALRCEYFGSIDTIHSPCVGHYLLDPIWYRTFCHSWYPRTSLVGIRSQGVASVFWESIRIHELDGCLVSNLFPLCRAM